MTERPENLPRLYVADALAASALIQADDRVAHYLKNVLRRQTGDGVRLFNGRNGEFLAVLEEVGKKGVTLRCDRPLREQGAVGQGITVMCPPLRKNRLDMLIEKAVELGANDFRFVVTDHTDVRDANIDRIGLQMIEAAEQSERLDVPTVHAPVPLQQAVKSFTGTIVAAIERSGAPSFMKVLNDIKGGSIALLAGPPGGFSDAEKEFLKAQENVIPANLGPTILRSETAALAMVAAIRLS